MGGEGGQIFVDLGVSSEGEAVHTSGGLGVDSSISTSQMEDCGHVLPNTGAPQVLEGGQVAANNFLH